MIDVLVIDRRAHRPGARGLAVPWLAGLDDVSPPERRADRDHNLLELGDGVIIGDAVHISGHTIEHEVVKTGRVVLASDVMVGLDTVIRIGVVAATGCQIGALSFVPKDARLDAHATYAGVPVRQLGV